MNRMSKVTHDFSLERSPNFRSDHDQYAEELGSIIEAINTLMSKLFETTTQEIA